MLKTKVKASAITNLTDARYFAAWEVEWLGFDLNESSDTYIQPHLVKAMKEWVDGVKIVGELDMHDADSINTAIKVLELDAVQVGMFTEEEVLMEVSKEVEVIKEIVIEAGKKATDYEQFLELFAPHVKYYLFNFEKNNITWENIKSDLEAWKSLCEEYPVIISINLNKESVTELLDTLQPYGINVRGGEEEKVGVKSFDDIDEIFEALEIFV